MICWIVNSVLCFLYRKEYKKYMSCSDIRKAQEDRLREILFKNQDTVYGKKYGFKNIQSIEEYRKNVPLTIYEDYLGYVEEIKRGEKNILTAEDVKLLELTSGSFSASKLIPYTESLKKEFQAGIKPWLYSLYKRYPEIKKGKSYWSVTPVTKERTFTKGNIPIGFDEDSEYFGKIEKYLMNMIFVSPQDIKIENDMEKFYFRTALALLSSQDLALISVWSPSFLLLLMQYIEENKEKLLQVISKKRKKEIEQSLEEKHYKDVWKKLRVISCWGDGNATHSLKNIEKLFKGVVIQPKGILATEGLLSFPVGDLEGSRISYYSHFFEFIEGETGEIYLADELEKGKSYELVFTTSGGLYRYCIGDIIEVVDIKVQNPIIRFIGRKGFVSDLFGEKICDAFVGKIHDKLGEGIQYFMLAPEKDRYVLYLKSEQDDGMRINDIRRKDIRNRDIDEMLRENFHYDYCRKLGQLKEMQIFRLTGEPEKEYTNYCIEKGQRLGDIKLRVLSLEGGWGKVYTGYLQKEEK